MKRSPLKRRSTLRSRPKPVNRTDPARIRWKTPAWGACTVCGNVGWLNNHHVVELAHIPEELPEMRYDLRNAMPVGNESMCRCHARHTNAFRRIPLSLVSARAWEFAVELFGEDTAKAYLARRYSADKIPSPSQESWAAEASPGADRCEGMATPAAGDASDSQHGRLGAADDRSAA